MDNTGVLANKNMKYYIGGLIITISGIILYRMRLSIRTKKISNEKTTQTSDEKTTQTSDEKTTQTSDEKTTQTCDEKTNISSSDEDVVEIPSKTITLNQSWIPFYN